MRSGTATSDDERRRRAASRRSARPCCRARGAPSRGVVIDEALDETLARGPNVAGRVGRRLGDRVAGRGPAERRRADEALPLEVAPLAVVEPGRDRSPLNLVERRVADGRQHLVEREARGDGLADLVEREGLAQAQVLGRQALLLEPALDDVDDLFDLEGLEDVVVGAALHRVDRRLDGAEAGHDHGERVRAPRVPIASSSSMPPMRGIFRSLMTRS